MLASKLLIRIGKKIALVFSALFGFWILGFFVFCFYFKTLRPDSPPTPVQALVVLTGDRRRINVAKQLFNQQFPRPLMHISGSNPDCRNHVAQDDPFSALISIDRASNTKENIALTRKWLLKHQIRSVRLLTSDYHLPRALLWTKTFPADVQVFSHPIRSLPRHWKSFSKKKQYLFKIFKEYNKYLLTWLYLTYKAHFKNNHNE